MEVKRKEKTLAGLFLKYVILFCTNTVLLIAGMFFLVLCISSMGGLLPANYAELRLTENISQICKAKSSLERWIPNGCTYGVYDADGEWLEGNLSQQEQRKAWNHYEKNNIYAEYKGYYRFIEMDNGNVCIVKYHLIMRYSNEKLNEFLLPPEVMMPIADIILFILNAVWLSGRFAKRVNIQLQELRVITEKIAGNDLDFERKTSDIKEIGEVMESLVRMKDTLSDSLKKQWDMEKQKQEQLSALAHDIKTPLTIIKGNTELLEEGYLPEENRECTAYILANVNEIEKYLETMQQVVHGKAQKTQQAMLPCESLKETFREMAKQLAVAEKMPVSFDIGPLDGIVYCSEADILRAWSNLIGNAAEHTNQKSGMEILIGLKYKGEQLYLVAAVRDYGAGFSAKDLKYADKEFYSGDASRHNRKHLGLGLSIAKKFAGEQGGFLEYGNCENRAGAYAALWLLCVR